MLNKTLDIQIFNNFIHDSTDFEGGGFGSKGNDGLWNVVRKNILTKAFASGIGVTDHSYQQVFEGNTLIDNSNGVHVFINSDNTYI